MPYEINFAKQFLIDFANIPKQVRTAYVKSVDPILRISPEKHNEIKKLKGTKTHWRYRIANDYRIIYEVDKNIVTLLMVGNRKNVYDRLKYDPDKEKFKEDIIGIMPELVEPTPSPESVGAAILQSLQKESTGPLKAQPLPFKITPDKLLAWAIPAEFHSAFLKCKTDEELLAVDVPSDIVEKILNIIYPTSIDKIKNTGKIVLDKPDDLEMYSTGQKNLSSFLLALDDIQKQYIEIFTKKATGPWLLKGGPGSGKSTIALYCIRSLLSNKLSSSQKILFTTYTNSLTLSSQQLLISLLKSALPDGVHIRTMNHLATYHADPHNDSLSIVKAKDEREILRRIIQDFQNSKKITSFTTDDEEFIREEIEWVILGNGLQNEDDYITMDRAGRGRRLGKNQKIDLWKIYDNFTAELNRQQLITHDQVVIEADKKVQALSDDHNKYDFVFIDEAQDFKPKGIAFCVKLAKNPKNVFLTADMNQAIYGRGVKWKSVHESLRFTKDKSEELKINYRSTKEIVTALKEIAEQIEDRDPETLILNTPFKGDPPIIDYCDGLDDEIDKISEFILHSLRKLNMGLGCAAVLCKNNQTAQKIAKELQIKLKSRYMQTRETELDYNGVKVMTIHAAKGLEFPVISVVGVNKNTFPSSPSGGKDKAEHLQSEWKLFFVACSRAMRALQVTTSKENPSPFMEYLTDECWSIHKSD